MQQVPQHKQHRQHEQDKQPDPNYTGYFHVNGRSGQK